MILLSGTVVTGVGDFGRRMSAHEAAFTAAVGERLQAGTVNVQLAVPVPVREHFRLVGATIGEPQQDLLFEVVRIGPHWGYRIRPLNLITGAGGHGDHVIEVACALRLPSKITAVGSVVELTFFRNFLNPLSR